MYYCYKHAFLDLKKYTEVIRRKYHNLLSQPTVKLIRDKITICESHIWECFVLSLQHFYKLKILSKKKLSKTQKNKKKAIKTTSPKKTITQKSAGFYSMYPEYYLLCSCTFVFFKERT